jgi:hypothetical protein
MSQNYVVWRDRPDGKRCHLGPLKNVKKDAYLNEGVPLLAEWPENACYEMDPDYKTRIQLTDSLIVRYYSVVVSERLKAFLLENGVEGNEFLPVAVINHKGRTVKEKYFLVNNVDQQDAFDQTKSVFEKNTIDTTQIDTVKKMVLDYGKIKPTAQFFRLKYYNVMILVRDDLAAKLTASGMTGFSFMTLDKFIEFTNS